MSGNKIIFQYAGDIGKYSLGYGKQVNKIYSFSLHYGLAPANDIQNKIETYTFKNNLNLFSTQGKLFQYSLYTGLGLFHIPGNKYKTHEQDGVSDNYYRQSSIRGLAYIGHELQYGKKASIYLESGMNDIWIINSINNDSIDYRDHVSLGIGFKYKF
jgi:hypothetical protein